MKIRTGLSHFTLSACPQYFLKLGFPKVEYSKTGWSQTELFQTCTSTRLAPDVIQPDLGESLPAVVVVHETVACRVVVVVFAPPQAVVTAVVSVIVVLRLIHGVRRVVREVRGRRRDGGVRDHGDQTPRLASAPAQEPVARHARLVRLSHQPERGGPPAVHRVLKRVVAHVHLRPRLSRGRRLLGERVLVQPAEQVAGHVHRPEVAQHEPVTLHAAERVVAQRQLVGHRHRRRAHRAEPGREWKCMNTVHESSKRFVRYVNKRDV